MGRMYHCPFFGSAKKKLVLHCELAELGFPDKQAQDSFEKRFCANQPGWKSCPLARTMQDYYERKDCEHAKHR